MNGMNWRKTLPAAMSLDEWCTDNKKKAYD